MRIKTNPYGNVIDEIKEVIPLNNEAKNYNVDPDEVELAPACHGKNCFRILLKIFFLYYRQHLFPNGT